METKLFAKPQLQQVLKDLRSEGYDVNKTAGGYKVYMGDKLILQAMNGNNAYLVRCAKGLLTPA